jgi:hypothetical protein
MSEIEEPDKSSDSSDAEEQLEKCDWKNCKKTHKNAVQYPGNGRYEKGSGYRKAWIKADMEPWKQTHGSPRLLADGTHDESLAPDYLTQGHHLIPTTLLNKTGTLKKNIELIGYDCDALENGMMLPEKDEHIPLHHLPAHRGYHPSEYMSQIQKVLQQLEKDAEAFCLADTDGDLQPQKQLIRLLNALSNRARGKILAIRTGKGFWPVRAPALHEYNAALSEYARRQRLHAELLKSRFHIPPGGTP